MLIHDLDKHVARSSELQYLMENGIENDLWNDRIPVILLKIKRYVRLNRTYVYCTNVAFFCL